MRELRGRVAQVPGGVEVEFSPPDAPITSLPTGIIVPPWRRGVTGEVIDRFSSFAKQGDQRELLEAVRVAEPRLTRLEVLTESGKPDLWGTLEGGVSLPVSQLGDGLGKLIAIYVAIPQARNGMVAVDEVEAGIHWKSLPRMWSSIIELANRFDVQIVATTHSDECVRAAYDAASGTLWKDQLVLHRMYRKGKEIGTAVYQGEALAAALESGFDVR
ncbi:MAG: ATP-binding protein [Chloroflexi bacterium]|nr:ATP-binding protein [Chloroflexota bacterium]